MQRQNFQPVEFEGEQFKLTLLVEAVDPGKGFRMIHQLKEWAPAVVAEIFEIPIEEAQPCNCSGS